MTYREMVLNKHIDGLLEALTARRTMEPRHGHPDHDCPECELLAEVRKCPQRSCLRCAGSGEIGLSDGDVPCPDCFGSGMPFRKGVFAPKVEQDIHKR